MNYLLKIVRGAQAGAEIALAEGSVTFGSSDACDIVLADASLPAEAFVLETSDAGVSLKELPDGEAKTLDLYTLFTFGNSSFAVGENGVAWPEVKEPAPAAAEPAADGSGETPLPPEGGSQLVATADEASSPPGEGRASARQSSEAQDSPPRRRRGLGCLFVLLLVVLFFAVGYFLALRYGRFWEKSFGESGVSPAVATSCDPPAEGGTPSQGESSASLADWAAEHGVAVSDRDGETVLAGNFTNRTERLVFAQDAYARDRNLVLDLSDDETLKAGVEEVLFALSEGRVKLETATNRVVKLVGRARSRMELLQTVAAICTDVNRVRVVDDTAVVCDDGQRTKVPTRYQAISPQAVRHHPFVVPAAAPAAAPAVPLAPLPAAKPSPSEPNCPVAGIILMPYPCLVMRDGTRAAVGAFVGEFKVEKIEADKVTLKRGEETVTWKP